MTRYQTLFIATSALLLFSTTGVVAKDLPAAIADDKAQITETVRAMFTAAATDDLTKLRAVIAPDFYAFDAGGRFTGDALMELIKAAHAAGKVYVWTVNDPDVHLYGDVAWITYVNRGSIKDASGTKQVSWLESAVLQRTSGRWLIQFFHSTRVP
jgi:ketosteroid isomerase-like protein